MTSIVVKAALLPAAVWLVGTIVIKYVRHGVVVQEDLIDAAILSAVVAVVGFAIELVRSRKRRRPSKSDADRKSTRLNSSH